MSIAVNRYGVDWQALKAWNLEQIERHRQELEALLVDADRAQQLRGMIAVLREQITLVEPPTPIDVKEPRYG